MSAILEEPAPDGEDADTDLREAPDVEKEDVDLGKKVASHRDHPVVKAAGYAGKIGNQGPLYTLSAGLLIIGLASRKQRLADSGVLMLAAVAAADLSKRLTKRLVRRTRPHVLLDDHRYETDTGGSDHKPEQSFPSGHMAGSVAAARAVSHNFPRTGAAAGAAAVAIGISRVAKGAHWPLDVVGGAIIGLAAEALLRSLLTLSCRWARPRRGGSTGRRRRRWLFALHRQAIQDCHPQ